LRGIIIPAIFSFQWQLYDRYLRSSGVRGGVASYGFFLRLLVDRNSTRKACRW